MREKIIEAHEIKPGIFVRQMTAFGSRNRVLLVGREYGTTFLLEKPLCGQLVSGEASADLLFKLIQHGLAYTMDTPRVRFPTNLLKPNFFIIEVTNRCNFGCTYCFRDPPVCQEQGAEFPLETTVHRIAEYCHKYRIKEITVQPWGGEPLLQLDRIEQLQKGFSREHIPCHITMMTNASLITPEAAEMLHRLHVDIGISLDGPEDIQDAQRPFADGHKSYEASLCGIRNLRKAGYQTKDLGTISVITRSSVYRIPEIISFLVQEMGIYQIKLNPVRTSGAMALSEDEIELYCQSLVNTLEEFYTRKIPVIEGNVRNRLRNLIDRSNGNTCDAFGCCGGRRMLTVDMHGNIFPCEKTDRVSERLGTFSDQADLREILENAVHRHPYFYPKNDSDCEYCAWWSYCRGGCTTAVQYAGGTPGSIDRQTCLLNRKLYPMLAEMILTKPDLALALAGKGEPG